MRRSNRTDAAISVAVLTCALTYGCTPDPGPVTPSPSAPTASTTPSLRENDVERRTRLDFEAAEKAYRANRAELNRLNAQGGADSATPALKATSSGEYLESLVLILQKTKKSGDRIRRPPKIERVVYGGYSPVELDMVGCVDYRTVVGVNKDGERITGKNLIIDRMTVQKTGSVWKIDSLTPEIVKTFDITNGCGD